MHSTAQRACRPSGCVTTCEHQLSLLVPQHREQQAAAQAASLPCPCSPSSHLLQLPTALRAQLPHAAPYQQRLIQSVPAAQVKRCNSEAVGQNRLVLAGMRGIRRHRHGVWLRSQRCAALHCGEIWGARVQRQEVQT